MPTVCQATHEILVTLNNAEMAHCKVNLVDESLMNSQQGTFKYMGRRGVGEEIPGKI